jgi:NUMOD3 motif
MKGKILSDEHKLKISNGLLNKQKSNDNWTIGQLDNWTIETKLKISLALKNHPSLTNSEKKYKPIILMDKDKNIIKTYKGVTIALKNLGIGQKRLKYIIENNLLYNDKYYLSYAPVNKNF